jgi:hypothetical protein
MTKHERRMMSALAMEGGALRRLTSTLLLAKARRARPSIYAVSWLGQRNGRRGDSSTRWQINQPPTAQYLRPRRADPHSLLSFD